jgi:hypothetical protein
VRPWIDHLGFLIVKAVGDEKTRGFFFKEESSNVFKPLYIKYLLYLQPCPPLPMDNDGAPFGAA